MKCLQVVQLVQVVLSLPTDRHTKEGGLDAKYLIKQRRLIKQTQKPY